MIKKIHDSSALAESQNDLIYQAFQEGFIDGEAVAIDATHLEARDRKPDKKKEEEVPVEQVPKKRGRKPKAEREKWLKEQQELEENRPVFENNIVGWYSPVKAGILWSGGGGHIRVLYGYYEDGSTQNVSYEDPSPNWDTWNSCSYNWFVSNSTWHWATTHYYSS